MFEVKTFICNPIRENTYIVSDETKEAVIIDCGAWYDAENAAIKEYITANGLKPVHLIATHGHVDHHLGDKFVFDTWGLKPELHGSDEQLMKQLPEHAAAICGINGLTSADFAPVGRYFDGSDVITFGNHSFTILEAPGHSPGGVVFYCEAEKAAFTGDTLFRGSIGRTDFEGGSMFMIIQSLRMLCQLPDTVTVYPGHGEPTTIGAELAANPYLDR
jgi:hydroxyacylglutathione hydrolase